MDESNRVQAILEIMNQSSQSSNSNPFFRQPKRQQSFDFSPFFRNACDSFVQSEQSMRATRNMNTQIRMPLRVQRA